MSRAQQEAILRGKQMTFGDYIWDSKEGTFLGRTPCSWLKIIIFYIIYYGFLAAFFAFWMIVFYTTLDTQWLPKYSPGNGNSILRNPSLGFRPQPRRENVESNLIWYTTGNQDDIEHWVNSLNEFIARTYEGTGYEDETSDVKDCSEWNVAGPGQVCKFDYQALGDKCTKAEDWGYPRRSPCVILKMNKMIGWIPDVYRTIDELPRNMPEDLIEYIKQRTENNGGETPGMVWVSCHGEHTADQEHIGELEYTPWRGFPAYYFPYMNIPGYLPPIVAVRFKNPVRHVLIRIRCVIWAKNIRHSVKNNLGLVNIELLVD